MASYRLSIKASAAKELAALGSKADRIRIASKIEALAENPRPQGAEKLAGLDSRYRVRQGNYRVVYLINDSQHLVTVYKVGDRKDIYK